MIQKKEKPNHQPTPSTEPRPPDDENSTHLLGFSYNHDTGIVGCVLTTPCWHELDPRQQTHAINSCIATLLEFRIRLQEALTDPRPATQTE